MLNVNAWPVSVRSLEKGNRFIFQFIRVVQTQICGRPRFLSLSRLANNRINRENVICLLLFLQIYCDLNCRRGWFSNTPSVNQQFQLALNARRTALQFLYV